MASIISLISLAIALLVSYTTAQANLCQYFGYSALQCQLCGYNPRAPIYCAAYNATFDDLTPAEAIPDYKAVSWPNFTVLAQAPVGMNSASSSGDLTLSPYSPLNYASLAANTTGSMQFGVEGIDSMPTNGQFPSGTLHYFHYACAVPGTNPPVATSCNIMIKGVCLAAGSSNILTGPFAEFRAILTYEPTIAGQGSDSGMAFMSTDFAYSGVGQDVEQPLKCINYSFAAVGDGEDDSTGQGVDLLLDDVIYTTYSKGNV